MTIDAITVGIETNAALTPPRVAKKMALSVEAVGQQILLGRSVAEVTQNRATYELLVKEIFDRVLSGYSVASVTISPSATAHINVVLTPWNDVVNNITIEMDFGSLSPAVAELIQADIPDLKNQIADILIGLPIEAVEWAGVMIKSVLREYLAERLPEFRPNFDISSGGNTVIKISLTPDSTIVRNVSVTTVSKTIPNIIASTIKPDLRQTTETMIGLPATFIERHKDYFIAGIKNDIANNSLVRRAALLTEPSLIITGTDCEITIGVETERYVINLEGYLDIWRSDNDDNVSAMLHLGRNFGSKNKNEVFTEITFMPTSVSFDFESGIARKFTKTTSFEFRYNLSETQTKLRLVQQIHPRYSIRIERILDNGENSFALRYSIHEMLSAEYVFTNKEKWLKLIAHM